MKKIALILPILCTSTIAVASSSLPHQVIEYSAIISPSPRYLSFEFDSIPPQKYMGMHRIAYQYNSVKKKYIGHYK